MPPFIPSISSHSVIEMKWKWIDFDHQLASNDTYLSNLLCSGQNNSIISQGTICCCFSVDSSRLQLHIISVWKKFKFEAPPHRTHGSELFCWADLFPAGQQKGRTGVGTKYFNNSPLTVRESAKEQDSQQGLVLDTVGVAVRGDRLVLVLHEGCPKTSAIGWVTAPATLRARSGPRPHGEGRRRHLQRFHLYTCWYKVFVSGGRVGGDELLLSQNTSSSDICQLLLGLQ